MMRLFPLTIALVLSLAAGCGPGGTGRLAGYQAPEFRIRPLENPAESKTNVDFKGKVLLIDFWATWCGPCRQTMPHIQEVYDRFRDRGLVVAAVSSEEERTVRSFVDSTGYSYPFYLDPMGNTNSAFGITGIPHAVVIDRQGVVRFMGHPALVDEMERAIEGAL
jgi:thiol-disulfide isomerase/thioredoxin